MWKRNWGISSDAVVVFARSISVSDVTEFDIFERERGGHDFCSCFGSTGTDSKGGMY